MATAEIDNPTAAGPEVSDRELLRRFARCRDQEAFAELVRRHGPLVLGVCRRVLRQEADAEDVFQATFMILARRAASVAWQASVSGWLYKVAYRAAVQMSRQQAARREQTCENLAMIADDQLDEVAEQDAQEKLFAELLDLPARYREAILVCCLEGRDRDEAARQIGCTPVVLKGRLQRARQMLLMRLGLRGILVTSVLAAAEQSVHAAEAALAPALVASTTQSAVAYAAGELTMGAAVAESTAYTKTLIIAILKGAVMKSLLIAACTLSAVWCGMVLFDSPLGADEVQPLTATGGESAPGPLVVTQATPPDDPARAEKLNVIRRLTRDLTGVPPTASEERAFLADKSPQAYQRLVERLLTTGRSPDARAPAEPTQPVPPTPVAAATPPAVGEPVRPSAREAAEQKIRQALDSPTRLEFVETPLNDVVEFLKDKHNIPIVLAKRHLENDGLDSNIPVTMNLSGVRLASALNLMLKPLSLTTVIQDEVLLVTTMEHAKTIQTTRTYPVGDLLAGNPPMELSELMRTITMTVATESWAKTPNPFIGAGAGVGPGGGLPPGDFEVTGTPESGRGQICALADLLVVRQTQAAHDELAQLLTQLRRDLKQGP